MRLIGRFSNRVSQFSFHTEEIEFSHEKGLLFKITQDIIIVRQIDPIETRRSSPKFLLSLAKMKAYHSDIIYFLK